MVDVTGRESPWDARRIELLARNVDIVRDGLLARLDAESDVTAEITEAFRILKLMVEGHTAMIVPPDMIPPDELAAAIERGKELAAEHGW